MFWYSHWFILFTQELHNEVFSGQKLAAVPAMPDEAKNETKEGKDMEMAEVLERMRSLVVEVRVKEEEGAR